MKITLKRLLQILAAAAMLVPAIAMAAVVTPHTARVVADNFLKYQVDNFGSWGGSTNPSVRSVVPVQHQGELIAFNVSVTPGGYMLIPYHDEFNPVVLFSYTESFNPGRSGERHSIESWILPEMATIRRNMQNRRGALEATKSFSYSESRVGRAWAVFTRSTSATNEKSAVAVPKAATVATVYPLLPTQWGQGGATAPFTYNLFTPAAGSCAHTYTGCLATAWSQVMRYWRWPAQGAGSHAYSWNGNTLARDFTQSIYDWDNMPAQLSAASTPAQIAAIARLMADVGIAVEMDYGCSGSSSSMYADDPAILPVYFGYQPGAVRYDRASTTTSAEWFSYFQSEFDAIPPRPIIFSVFTKNNSGHEIVADGYQAGETNFIHVNMGWAGADDAYYNVDSDFTTGSYIWDGPSHVIVTGIQPTRQFSLDLAFAGGGGGSVNGALSCTSGVDCPPALFTIGTAVNLISAPDSLSTFGGWSGECTSSSVDCSLVMDSDKSVTATFTAAPKAMIGTTGYDSIQTAYNAAATDETIRLLEGSQTENLIFSEPVSILLDGGWLASFDSVSTETSINGPMKIRAGTVRVKRVNVQ